MGEPVNRAFNQARQQKRTDKYFESMAVFEMCRVFQHLLSLASANLQSITCGIC
jgi:hypothetical protein